MKFLFVFLFPFFMATSSTEPTPVADSCADDALKIRVCWKGPKGNRTCITVVSGGKLRDIEKDIMTTAFMAADNSSILLDMSSFSGKSFKLAESAKIDMCNSTMGLKAGTEIKVVNGYAVLK